MVTGRAKCSFDFKKMRISSESLILKKARYSVNGKQIVNYKDAILRNIDVDVDLNEENCFSLNLI